MKLDIIIPSFRDARIIRTIASIRANTFYPQTRLLIIDGGSDEPLLAEIGQELRTSDILISEPDKGIFDALNKGLDHCTSDFIYWLGSDDFINPDFDFQVALDQFEDDQVVGVVGKTYYFDEGGITRPLYYREYTLNSYKNGRHIPHFSSIWKRDFIGELRFDLQYWISSDYDFFFRLFERLKDRRVIALEDVLVYMQEGGNSSRDVKRQLEGVQQLREIHQKHTNFIGGIKFVLLRYMIKIKLKVGFKLQGKAPIIDHLSKIALSRHSQRP